MSLSRPVIATIKQVAQIMAAQRTGRLRVSYQLWDGPEMAISEEEISDSTFDLDRQSGATLTEERTADARVLHEVRLFTEAGIGYYRSFSAPATDEGDSFFEESDGPEPDPEEDELWVRRRIPPSRRADLLAAITAQTQPFDFVGLIDLPGIEAESRESSTGKLLIEFRGFYRDFPVIAKNLGHAPDGLEDEEVPTLVRLEIELASQTVSAASIEVMAPVGPKGSFRVSVTIHYFGYGRPVKLEEPVEGECVPEVPPIEARVSAIAISECSYQLSIRFDNGLETTIPLLWLGWQFLEHGDYPLVTPIVGERILLSGAWREPGDRSRSDGSDERVGDDDFFDPESILSPGRGFLFDAKGTRESEDGISRDESGLLEAAAVNAALVLGVSEVKERRRIDFQDAEGGVYWKTAEPEAPLPALRESVTLYRSPNLGRTMIDYALRPDGSLLIGYEMAK
jgi:hypothetical protein